MSNPVDSVILSEKLLADIHSLSRRKVEMESRLEAVMLLGVVQCADIDGPIYKTRPSVSVSVPVSVVIDSYQQALQALDVELGQRKSELMNIVNTSGT
jgi:DNA repair protein RadC